MPDPLGLACLVVAGLRFVGFVTPTSASVSVPIVASPVEGRDLRLLPRHFCPGGDRCNSGIDLRGFSTQKDLVSCLKHRLIGVLIEGQVCDSGEDHDWQLKAK